MWAKALVRSFTLDSRSFYGKCTGLISKWQLSPPLAKDMRWFFWLFTMRTWWSSCWWNLWNVGSSLSLGPWGVYHPRFRSHSASRKSSKLWLLIIKLLILCWLIYVATFGLDKYLLIRYYTTKTFLGPISGEEDRRVHFLMGEERE